MAAPLGWGVDPYGKGIYGSITEIPGIHFVGAVALSTRTVSVELSGEALHVSATGAGDALNPEIWSVQCLGTGEFLHVISVTATTPKIFVLTALEDFGDASVVYRVSAASLVDSAGRQVLPPYQADFFGVVKATEVERREIETGTRDIRNAPLPRGDPDLVGGTLSTDGMGDYALHSGVELLKKLILRRLYTRPGEFFHLPEYGVGLREKEPIPLPSLTMLKARIEQQLVREPELESLRTVLYGEPGQLTILISGKLRRTGQPFSLSVPVVANVHF